MEQFSVSTLKLFSSNFSHKLAKIRHKHQGRRPLSIGKNIFLVYCLGNDVFLFYKVTLKKEWQGDVIRINLAELYLWLNIILSTVLCLDAQSCPCLCGPVDCSLPGSSAHGILQARILEWGALSYSRGSSWPRDRVCISCVFCIGRQILYH